jgi:hypothetical protein
MPRDHLRLTADVLLDVWKELGPLVGIAPLPGAPSSATPSTPWRASASPRTPAGAWRISWGRRSRSSSGKPPGRAWTAWPIG